MQRPEEPAPVGSDDDLVATRTEENEEGTSMGLTEMTEVAGGNDFLYLRPRPSIPLDIPIPPIKPPDFE